MHRDTEILCLRTSSVKSIIQCNTEPDTNFLMDCTIKIERWLTYCCISSSISCLLFISSLNFSLQWQTRTPKHIHVHVMPTHLHIHVHVHVWLWRPKASHLCCMSITCDTHTPGHSSIADETWYWPKHILCIGWLFKPKGHSRPRELWFSIYLCTL